jgi:hypothetical protein
MPNNDTPFVELPQPPRSFAQPPNEADLRGNDFARSVGDDEYVRATAYRDHIFATSTAKANALAKLAGDPAAYRSLQHKTLPLTKAAPPYLDSK